MIGRVAVVPLTDECQRVQVTGKSAVLYDEYGVPIEAGEVDWFIPELYLDLRAEPADRVLSVLERVVLEAGLTADGLRAVRDIADHLLGEGEGE